MKAAVSTAIVIAALIAVSPADAATRRGLPPSSVQPVKVLENVARQELPAVDVQAHLAEDARREESGQPVPRRFAAKIGTAISPENAGTWETLADGSSLWRIRLSSPGALNLNLGMERFRIPAGSALWLSSTDGSMVQGPYTSEDRNAAGGLWTAAVVSDEIVLELHLPEGTRDRADLLITSVNHGYRELGRSGSNGGTKQGSCNIDVVCPESAGWEDQIRAVAHISISGMWVCTGQLVNNTAEDGKPYFLTAQHCVENASDAPTVVAYWNFESPICGQLNGGSLSHNQSGSTLVALWEWKTGSDFALVELDAVPDSSFNVYYSGWDATGNIPTGGVAIHHPSGDEKAITFDDDPLRKVDNYGYGSHQWRVDQYELGTTEGGSSGGCIFDPVSRRCIGTLTAGSASCDNPSGYDVFGRMDVHWTGDGSSTGRLSTWLDPLNIGARTLAGRDSGLPSGYKTWLVPAAASAPGVGTSNWKTQIVVPNTTAAAREARVHYVEGGESWPGIALSGPHSIPAGGSLFLDDPLAGLNPTSGVVYVTVDGDGTPVTTRTYNLAADGGTFGQGIPGINLTDASSVTGYTLPMFMSAPNRFRANLGIVHTSSGSIAVQVQIHSPDGSLLASRGYSAPSAYTQINNLAKSMGITNHVVEGGWVSVQLLGGSPAYWTCYLSIVDESTDDPTYIMPVVQ